MKKLLLFIILTLVSIVGYAQSAYAVFNSVEDPVVKSVSLHNVWFGSKLTTTFTDDDNGLADNILLSGKIIYDATIGGIKIPIVSNVNLDFGSGDGGFLNGDKGISLGIYPYKVIASGAITTVLHGGLAYKLLPGEEKYTPQQTKLFAGLEFAKKVVETSYPITLSITPLYAINNLENENFFGLESTMVFPISGGLGLLAEYNTPFTKNVDSRFSLGAILRIQP